MEGTSHYPSAEGEDTAEHKPCSDAAILFAETVVETTERFAPEAEELPPGCHTIFTPDFSGDSGPDIDPEAELAAINAEIAELEAEPKPR